MRIINKRHLIVSCWQQKHSWNTCFLMLWNLSRKSRKNPSNRMVSATWIYPLTPADAVKGCWICSNQRQNPHHLTAVMICRVSSLDAVTCPTSLFCTEFWGSVCSSRNQGNLSDVGTISGSSHYDGSTFWGYLFTVCKTVILSSPLSVTSFAMTQLL
jgi:hypothetical protein